MTMYLLLTEEVGSSSRNGRLVELV